MDNQILPVGEKLEQAPMSTDTRRQMDAFNAGVQTQHEQGRKALDKQDDEHAQVLAHREAVAQSVVAPSEESMEARMRMAKARAYANHLRGISARRSR